MPTNDIVKELKDICSELSGQAVDAAHYLINNPNEVAFHSMRQIARQAGVQPVSLVRVAQRLGLPGYNELRGQFIEKMRDRHARDKSSTRRNERSAEELISKKGQANSEFIDSFFAAELEVVRQAREHLPLDKLTEAVKLLSEAPKIYVSAKRTAFAPAYTFAYSLRKARPNVFFLDGVGGAPEGMLEDVGPGDVFVAVTFAPFNKLVHGLAEKASKSGARIIAITDSYAAPIKEFADQLHFVTQTSGQSFPESTLGATAIAHLLVAMTVSNIGTPAHERIRKNEEFIVQSGEYILNGKNVKRI